jgi:hypothetical protein
VLVRNQPGQAAGRAGGDGLVAEGAADRGRGPGGQTDFLSRHVQGVGVRGVLDEPVAVVVVGEAVGLPVPRPTGGRDGGEAVAPDAVQRLSRRARRDTEDLWDDVREYVVERLGDADGVVSPANLASVHPHIRHRLPPRLQPTEPARHPGVGRGPRRDDPAHPTHPGVNIDAHRPRLPNRPRSTLRNHDWPLQY